MAYHINAARDIHRSAARQRVYRLLYRLCRILHAGRHHILHIDGALVRRITAAHGHAVGDGAGHVELEFLAVCISNGQHRIADSRRGYDELAVSHLCHGDRTVRRLCRKRRATELPGIHSAFGTDKIAEIDGLLDRRLCCVGTPAVLAAGGKSYCRKQQKRYEKQTECSFFHGHIKRPRSSGDVPSLFFRRLCVKRRHIFLYSTIRTALCQPRTNKNIRKCLT
ncbi:unknown [Anaerotruncus sp. CAG:390]|nr:unknown [Anaerotruncus sp. CAG:390]